MIDRKRQRYLDRRIREVYEQAEKDIREKLADFVKRSERKGKIKFAQYQAGTITKEQYQRWLSGQVFIRERWEAKLEQVTEVLKRSNEKALAIIREEQFNVFADGANHQAYVIESVVGSQATVSFDIYNVDAVNRLIEHEPELLPRKRLNGRKDVAWNRQQIANCITQGIIQGESIHQIAERMAKETSSSNMKAMYRYARTAMTGAQNAGRVETMHRAQGMGIKVQKQWVATLDDKTRDSHQKLDGQTAEVDGYFHSPLGRIRFPGDPEAKPGDVYFCRCAMKTIYPEYPNRNRQRRDNITGELVGDITYEEWLEMKQGK